MRTLAGLLLIFLLGACFSSPSGGNDQADRGPKEAILDFTGTIVYVPLEGGFFGIVDRNGRQYDPLHLPESLRRDGLQVRVKARPVPEAIGFRMWGLKIEIIDIRAES